MSDAHADLAATDTHSRRDFLKRAAVTTGTLLLAPETVVPAGKDRKPTANDPPWYRSTLRWGQTNITEIDPTRYDIEWWRKYWRRTETQGIIVNAGGIVAYYPSQISLHQPAHYLGSRDLFGEICRAAHADRLVVLARMDSNRAHDEFYRAHPDWFAVDAEGRPHRAGDMFITCINGPYYEQHIPSILREIAEKYHPEGFTDNSWSGLGRNTICYCQNCREKFRNRTGREIPQKKDWDEPIYREWIQWNYERRLEIWDLNNRTTRASGGPDCIWAGMNSGSITGQSQSFRDYKAICERAEIIMLDHQSRSDSTGFQNNGETGKLIHSLLGWEKLVPESMAMYQAGRPTFRLASKPVAEAHLWMLDGIAGGLQPWWHHVGAYHEDQRMFHTAEPVLKWHKANELYLTDRTPVAPIGVVWSQQNTDFYGRDEAEVLVDLPWRGMTQALVRARIPYLPVHIDHIERDGPKFAALILPNLAAMSDLQAQAVRRFVAKGGNLLATGETSLWNEWGEPRPDFALADLFGAHIPGSTGIATRGERLGAANETAHTYLRITADEAEEAGSADQVQQNKPHKTRLAPLQSFRETDILPFGGVVRLLNVAEGTRVLLTFIPGFPIYPPETAWMREPKTNIPGLILNRPSNGSRIAFLPADIDRRFARDNLPDHGDLLRSLFLWILNDQAYPTVKGPGLIDCHLYKQTGRLIMHLVNLTSIGAWRQTIDETIPVGPIEVLMDLPRNLARPRVRLLVGERPLSVQTETRRLKVVLKSIAEHEMIIIGN